MLYERAGFIKEKHFTPAMELHEYYTCCNMKLSGKTQRHRQRELQEDDVLYNRSSKEGTEEFTVKVHPISRCPYIVMDGVEHPIDVNRDKDLPSIRYPEKKNPILYLHMNFSLK